MPALSSFLSLLPLPLSTSVDRIRLLKATLERVFASKEEVVECDEVAMERKKISDSCWMHEFWCRGWWFHRLALLLCEGWEGVGRGGM